VSSYSQFTSKKILEDVEYLPDRMGVGNQLPCHHPFIRKHRETCEPHMSSLIADLYGPFS